MAHLADSPANDVRECLEYLDRRAEGVYQFPIVISIFFEGLFSFMKELEDGVWRI